MDSVPGSLASDQAGQARGQAASGAAEARPLDAPAAMPAALAPVKWGDAALALGALALALIGAFYFKNRTYLLDGMVFYGLAIILFIILVRRQEPPEAAAGQRAFQRAWQAMRSHPVRTALVVISLALSYTVVRSLRSESIGSYWDIFAIWAAGSVCYVAAFAHRPAVNVRAWLHTYGWDLVAVGVLTAAAALFRLWQLGALPGIIGGDEGRLGLLGDSALNGELRNMFGTVYGNSTLYLYLIGIAIKLFGANMLGLRLMSAIGGILAVPALYLFGRAFFSRHVALVAAALLAVSHLHLHFSRVIVATSIQDALFAPLVLYLLLTGLERRSGVRLVLCGVVLGFDLYIYMGGRLLILFIPVYLLALLLVNPRLVKDNLLNLLAMAGALAIVGIPMALWALQHPDDFMARANQVGVIQSGWLADQVKALNQSQYRILATLLLQAFLTVNYYPAEAFYNGSLPMLDFVTGAIFMLGIAYATYRTLDHRYLLVNGWFWSGVVVGGALVVLPATAAYRILIVFPAVCLFVAIGWDRLVEFTARATDGSRAMRLALTVGLVAIFSVLNLRAYFVDFAQSCRYEDTNTRFASYMGQTLGQAGPEYEAYLFGFPRIWYGIHPSVDYLSGRHPITDVKEPLTGPTSFPTPTGKAIFFFTPERENELRLVEQSLPGGQARRVLDCGSPILTIYQVDG